MQAISIVGLGWLGLPLADLFIRKGYSVAGTCTSNEKLKAISSTSLSVVRYHLYEDLPTDIPVDYFADSILVLNIPPGRKDFKPQVYVSLMQGIIDHAFAHGLTQLIFISTTSVFGDTNGIITNQTPVAPKTPSAKAHVQIENHIKTYHYDKACILRPSGLVGPNRLIKQGQSVYRHPIYSLVKREQLDSGSNAVNLIHQADLLKVIAVIVDNRIVSSAYNISALGRTSRRDYYIWCASQLQLSVPNFADPELTTTIDETKEKTIDASETLADLGICLAYPSPFDMLPTASP